MPKLMRKRRTLITSPLAWQMTADPVAPPMISVIAERGGTQLKTPRPVLLVDTREQNPLDFSRFDGWFAGIEKKALKLGDYSIAGMRRSASWNGRIFRIWFTPVLPAGPSL
jgi:hypothetical protein